MTVEISRAEALRRMGFTPDTKAIDEVQRQLDSQIRWCEGHEGNELLAECLKVAKEYAESLRP